MTLAQGPYELIMDSGEVVGLRRFDAAQRMWIVLRFDAKAGQQTEQHLMTLLVGEYVRQQLES